MFKTARHHLAGYGIAILSVSLALLITRLLWPVMNQSIFLFFILAVLISATCGGMRAGVLAAILGALLTEFFFVLPAHSVRLETTKSLLPLFLFAPLGLLVSLITARGRRAQAALRESIKVKEESLALLETLLSKAPIGFAFHDRAHRFVRINERLAEINGLSVEQHLGRRLSELLPEIGQEAEAYFQQVLDTGEAIIGNEVSGETSAAPGVLRHWLVSYYPVRVSSGEIVGTGVLVEEITERKQAEQLARLQASALQAAANAIVITDKRGKITWANPAFASLTGYATEEVLGKHPNLLKSGKQDRDFYKRLWHTVLSGQVWQGELINRRKDGSLYFEEQTITPVTNEAGEITNFVAIKQDVSKRTQLEDQLRQSQKMEAIGRLAGGVAHDFNNLLTVIVGYSQMGLDALGPDNPARLSIAEVLRAGQRAAALTNQLLAFSRKQVFQPKVFSLNETIADLQKMLCRLIGEDINLITALERDGCFVESDPGQLQQVIMNLVVNARDAMPDGGQLTINTSSVNIDAASAARCEGLAPGRYVMLSVSDTGCGMDQETVSHIFEPFFTTKEQGKGTGLGLATVYGIVKQSRGHIAVASQTGMGTTFMIYLPRIDRRHAMEELRSEIQTISGGTETVLLAEDDVMVRRLTAQTLRDHGYTVWEAGDGREALRVLEAHQREAVALLVSDVVMPKMNGFELADQVTLLRPGTPVLFVSGYPERGLMRDKRLSQDQRHLLKPFTLVELLRKVREVLDEGSAATC
ncbi:MAG TPA: PAS domain S-box protein [Blastocatellia bacterium]|nr:PAS domain S-box protein [Blastocatellia bacterium]